MRQAGATQTLSYPLRLPDAAQADALRLLDVSREVVNAVITALWPRLDEFGKRTNKYAYRQVEEMISSPMPHGDRQWRCEAEQAGRILRAQADRKKQFALILPILSQGMIEPKTEKKPAGKKSLAIKQALSDLREANSDGGSAVELQSLIEQSCNFYLKHGCFPDTYEELQAIPLQKAAVLPYAGDDGAAMGQAYRMSLNLEHEEVTLAIRSPDEAGIWACTWRDKTLKMKLPEPVLDFIVEVPVPEQGRLEDVRHVLGWDWGVRTLVTATVVDLEGNRVARPLFLDSGGFDGRQARTRRHIDRLKKKAAKLEARRDSFPEGDPRREPSARKLAEVRRQMALCWQKYENRNHDLAHLAANILLLLATVWDVEVIAGESLKSLKTTGRGRDTKSRWRNFRNNAQIRGELWRCLRYKCHLTGIRLEWQYPKGTTHTCPHCGKPANTYASPSHRSKPIASGAWLRCFACGWNGARDYAAAINIALLGVAFLLQYLQTGRYDHPSMADKAVNSGSYRGSGLVLRLPPTVSRGCLMMQSGKLYCNGWLKSVTLHSSYPRKIMLRLGG
jgi:putative transposase